MDQRGTQTVGKARRPEYPNAHHRSQTRPDRRRNPLQSERGRHILETDKSVTLQPTKKVMTKGG